MEIIFLLRGHPLVINVSSLPSIRRPAEIMQDSDDYMIGSYVTKPGTPLGEPERINLLYPETTAIGILADNLTAIGGTMISISEVRTQAAAGGFLAIRCRLQVDRVRRKK